MPDQVAVRAKTRALEERTTLTALIVEGLESRLGRSPRSDPLPISRASGGLRPGVSWEDLAAAEGGEAYR